MLYGPAIHVGGAHYKGGVRRNQPTSGARTMCMQEQDTLVELLAEQAEARVKELVEQAKQEFYEAADRAFAQAMERFTRPFRCAGGDSQHRDGCCHRHAG
jgi:hypothetical protein